MTRENRSIDYRAWPTFTVLVLLQVSCATDGADRAWPTPRPLGAAQEAYRPPQAPPEKDSSAAAAPSPTGEIDLSRALGLAQMHNPELRAVAWEVREGEARARQAGLFPNPEVELELENFGGQRQLAAVDGAEATVSVSQEIETWGKRPKRVAVERAGAALSGWSYEALRLGVVGRTTVRFVELLAAQERVQLAAEVLQLTEQVQGAVAERVAAGKVAPLDLSRADVALGIAKVSMQRAESDLETARQALAAMWGALDAGFDRGVGDFRALEEVPDLRAITSALGASPQLARWDHAEEKHAAAIDLAVANAVPDVAVVAGVKRHQELDETAFTVGLAVPVPLFDRNQGEIEAGRFALARVRQARRAAEVQAHEGLVVDYRELASSLLEARSIEAQMLPAAEQAYAAAREGFGAGKYAFLDVLDAQRTLFEVKERQLNVLTDYHRARARVERTIGRPLGGESHE